MTIKIRGLALDCSNDPLTDTLEIFKVGTQLKLSGGAADYATLAVAADGALTITTVDADAAEGDICLMPDGNVGIGTLTLASDDTGINKLLVIGGATVPGLILQSSSTTQEANIITTGSGLYIGCAGSATGANNDILFRTIDTNSSMAYEVRMTVEAGGNVGIGSHTPDRLLHAEVLDAGTNAVVYAQRLSHITSGTAVAGFGTGIEFELEENDASNRVAAYITADWQDAGEGASADGRLNFGVMTADAAAATAMSVWNGNVGIGIDAPLAKCHIDQSNASGALPVLSLDQADISDGFINFIGATAASAAGPISSWTNATINGFVRAEVNGAQVWLATYNDPTS